MKRGGYDLSDGAIGVINPIGGVPMEFLDLAAHLHDDKFVKFVEDTLFSPVQVEAAEPPDHETDDH